MASTKYEPAKEITLYTRTTGRQKKQTPNSTEAAGDAGSAYSVFAPANNSWSANWHYAAGAARNATAARNLPTTAAAWHDTA